MTDTKLARAIRKATLRSLKARDQYTLSVVRDLNDLLGDVVDDVARAVLKYRLDGGLPESVRSIKGLEKMLGDIDRITLKLEKDASLRYKAATVFSFRLGIEHGIGDLVTARLPDFKSLTPNGIKKRTAKVFTTIDTHALDFMTRYTVTLAGDVSRELRDGIKRVVMSGLVAGKDTEDLVRDMGRIVRDQDAFRYAGSRVYARASDRMRTIARTETIRAYNQGRVKFFKKAGIEKVEWLAMGDERMCDVCGPLNGEVFELGKLPPIPRHPNCRCGFVVVSPMS